MSFSSIVVKMMRNPITYRSGICSAYFRLSRTPRDGLLAQEFCAHARWPIPVKKIPIWLLRRKQILQYPWTTVSRLQSGFIIWTKLLIQWWKCSEEPNRRELRPITRKQSQCHPSRQELVSFTYYCITYLNNNKMYTIEE